LCAYVPADATASPSSLASFISRLVLPFWYWLTRVVPENSPLNGCSSSSSSSHCIPMFVGLQREVLVVSFEAD